MIVFFSDLDLKGSGYMNITIALANELATKYQRKVVILGIGYDGAEHNWPFQIIPVFPPQAFTFGPAILNNLINLGEANQNEKVECFVVALDIPHHERILSWRPIQERRCPYLGIFPVESGPLTASWANILLVLDGRCAISHFGMKMLEDAGVMARHLQVGIDCDAWRLPSFDERRLLRDSMGMKDDEFVILTVADNQERKNLSCTAKTIQRLVEKYKVNAKWYIVTRINSSVGWKLNDLAIEHKIMDRMATFDRGIDHSRLWILNVCADAFLLTSKAEGLCAVPDSSVLTDCGRKNIENIEENEHVYTHKGQIKKVTNVYKRDYEGDLIVIKPHYGLESIRLTPEHPVLVFPRRRKGTWIWGKRRLLFGDGAIWTPAWSLAKGDFLFVPFPEREDKTFILIEDYFEPEDLVKDNGMVVLKGRNQFGATFPHPSANKHKNVIDVDDDFLFILGLYIAEGCWTPQGPDFSLDTREVELQNRLIQSMERKFGITGTVHLKSRHRWSCRYNDRMIGRLLSRLCGWRSNNKHIPAWALWLPPEKLWKLLEGMFLGDGHFRQVEQTYLSYSTVSENLANDLQTALIGLGIMPYLNRATRGDFEIKIYRPNLGKIAFLHDYELEPALKKSSRLENVSGGLAIPIKSIDVISYVGPVYNLEVEEDESYMISNVAVHNCMPVVEAMATGTPVVATDCTSLVEHLYEDYENKKGLRGFPIKVEYLHQDPWGNSYRHYASSDDAAKQLYKVWKLIKSKRIQPYIDKGRAYAESREWYKAGDALNQEIISAIRQYEIKMEALKQTGEQPSTFTAPVDTLNPPTVPHVISPFPASKPLLKEGENVQETL